MPLYEYLCLECGKTSEVLVMGSDQVVDCAACGSGRMRRLLSAHSSMSGSGRNAVPSPGDTACCGSTPSAAGCAGPGSCCGKTAF